MSNEISSIEVAALKRLQKAAAYAIAERSGFHEGENNFGEKIALIHSELSEALESHRRYSFTQMDDKLSHHPAIAVELADTIIRILDLSELCNLDVASAIQDKLIYNSTRIDHRPEERAKVGGKKY